jgi:hypothetical protein
MRCIDNSNLTGKTLSILLFGLDLANWLILRKNTGKEAIGE